MEKEESDQIQKSVLRLRRGFIFSLGTLITLLILWILNAIYFSYVYYLQLLFSPPILFTLPLLLAFLYMGGIYNRASAWEQMNERNVSTVLSIGGSIVFLSPLFLLCLWIECPNYLAIPLAIWLIYTVFELHALNLLEKNCEMNLKKAKTLTIIGMTLAIASFILLLIMHYMPELPILFTVIYIFPYPNLPIPFLITSCILIIRELTRKIKTTY